MRALCFVILATLISSSFQTIEIKKCGCRIMRKCYRDMLKSLTKDGEAQCINEAIISTMTIKVFLRGLQQFCGEYIKVRMSDVTSEHREISEVVITQFNNSIVDGVEVELPVIMVEAGQDADTQPVFLALFIIEQMIACAENEYMLQKVKWIFLPCTNPDGLEYARSMPRWSKNVRKIKKMIGMGVDITRNFDSHFHDCQSPETAISPTYHGPKPESENETLFIVDMLKKYKKNAVAYISIRKGGHSLNIPYGYSDTEKPPNVDMFKKITAYLAFKVNRKMGMMHLFSSSTLFQANGKTVCGHSVDYAQTLGINSVEWKVYMDSKEEFLGYIKADRDNLRLQYFSILKEAHNVYSKFDKFKDYFENEFAKTMSLND